VSWSNVMVENPITGTKFRPFSTQSLMKPLKYFYIISLFHCLALWDEFNVDNTLDIEESDEHCLHV
jgi:hypothetical protein